MYRAGDTDFHNLFTNGSVQDLVIFASSGDTQLGTFVAADGDIVGDGLRIYKTMVADEDIRYGDILGSTMSVSVFNRNLALKGFSLDKFDVYIGALSSVTSHTIPSGSKMYFEWTDAFNYATHTISVPNSTYGGILIGGTQYFTNTNVDRIYAEIWGIWLYIYCYDSANDEINLAWVFPGTTEDPSAITVRTYTGTNPGAYTADKLKHLYQSNTVHLYARESSESLAKYQTYGMSFAWSDIYADGIRTRYEYAPAGQYKAQSRAFTMSDIVEITDAADGASDYDADATDKLNAFFPQTSQYTCKNTLLANALIDSVDITILQAKNISLDGAEFFDESYTLRGAATLCLEYSGGIVVKNGLGVNKTIVFPTTPTSVKTITQANIEQPSLNVNEYQCETPTKVRVYLPSGTEYYESGTGDNVYTVYGNPIMTTQADADAMLTVVSKIPTYTPMSFTELKADPSIELGDFITVQTPYGNYVEPVLTMDIRWNGFCFIDYTMPGTDLKYNHDRNSQQSYNTSISLNKDYFKSRFDENLAGHTGSERITYATGSTYVGAEIDPSEYEAFELLVVLNGVTTNLVHASTYIPNDYDTVNERYKAFYDAATEPDASTKDNWASHAASPLAVANHAWGHFWHDTTNDKYYAYVGLSSSASGVRGEIWGIKK